MRTAAASRQPDRAAYLLARVRYDVAVKNLAWCDDHCRRYLGWPFPFCLRTMLEVDAAAISLDLAIAEQHPSPPDLWRYIENPAAGIP